MAGDTGDPRLATPIWSGIYEVTPAEGVTLSSPTVMLTKANYCQFCGDAEGVTAETAFATMAEECRPVRTLALPVCAGDGVGVLTVGTDGTLTCSEGGTVHLDGFSYHICDRWY